MVRTISLFTLLAIAASALASPQRGDPWERLRSTLFYGVSGAGKSLDARANEAACLVFRDEDGDPTAHLLVMPPARGDDKREPPSLDIRFAVEIEEAGRICIGRLPCRLEGDDLVLEDGGRFRPDDGTVRVTLQESLAHRYLLTRHVDAASLAAEEQANAPKTDDGIWKRLAGTDYVDDARDAGTGLRFHEKAGKRLCTRYEFGSGEPIIGEETFEIVLKDGLVTVGDRTYRVDPVTLGLTGPEKQLVLPDTFVLNAMIQARRRESTPARTP